MQIVTDHVYPPIPLRDFDWCAFDRDTYDPDASGGVRRALGWGATKEAAIADLLEQINEQAE